MTIPEWDGVRSLTFDAAGTLLEPWPSVGHVYSEAARDAGFGELDPEELNRRFRQVWSNRNSFDYSRSAWSELVATALDGLTPAATDAHLFEALWQRFSEARSWKVFPDVVPCLKQLSASGWPLAVVSNWDERLHQVLANTGLDSYFEFILPSTEAPAPKPDPRIFWQAAQRLGVTHSTLLHVGDRVKEDVVGARSAGCHSVRIDREAIQGSADLIISLEELPRRLARR